MIDRRLHILRMVRQHGTITEAAKALHLTPSAVSQQLRRLARDLEVDLLQRHGRRVRLTAAADIVLDHGDAIFARWEQALADLDAHRVGERGPVRLCGFPSAVVALLAPATRRLREEAPGLRLEITQAKPSESLDMLLSGEADLAVLEASPGTPSSTDARFHQESLLDDPLQLIVPAGHPLSRSKEVALGDAADEPWIGGPLDKMVRAACSDAGFVPHVAHRARDWSAYLALVGAGLGVALVPRLAAIPDAQIERLTLKSPVPTRRVLTCVRRGSHQQPILRLVRQSLQDAANSVRPDGD